MSTSEHEDDGQTLEEMITDPSFQKGIKERLGRRMASLHILKDAIGAGDHKRMLDRHAAHVERSWRMSMHALGFHSTEELDKGIEETEMGDVSVNGDTVINIAPDVSHGPQHPPEQPQLPPPPQQPNKWLPWALAAGIAASSMGSSAYLINKSNTVITPEPDNRTIGLTVTDD